MSGHAEYFLMTDIW